MKKAIVFLLAAGILSCNAGQQGQSDGRHLEQLEQSDIFDMAVFEAERAAWEASGLSAYQFTAEIFGPRMDTFTVTVRPGTEPEVRCEGQDRGMKTNDPEWVFEWAFAPLRGVTIDELYASMRENAVMDASENRIVRIRYNKEYHYPESFFSGPSETGIDGGWYDFKITQFEVLGSGDEGL